METRFSLIAKRMSRALTAVLTFSLLTGNAFAASAWNPTLLVNTESFQVIDEGNGTSNVYIQFGSTLNKTITYNRTTSRFEFNDSVSVRGTLSGSTLSIDGTANIRGATTITGNTKVRGNLSGSTLNVDGTAIFNGTLSATGAITTKSNLTINGDNDTNDATFTFGNQTSAQTLKYSHANQRFEFSKDVRVLGNLSGSSLTVDGNVTLRGVTYSAPTTQGSANTYLKNDGAGNLTWTNVTNANGSGGSLSLHPEYPNAVYTASGSTTNVGTLAYSYDSTNKENFYRWSSTQGTLQDYWIAVRVKVPKNFNNWTPTPIQFRYRTKTASAASNYLTLKLLDTTGALVATTGGSLLNSADTWATATIGNVASGTYTPDGFITILVKVASTGAANYADAGYININWSTTTP